MLPPYQEVWKMHIKNLEYGVLGMYIYSNRGAIEFFGPSPGRRLPSPATASQVTASKMHPLPAYFAGHLYAFQTTTTIQVEWLG